ncbi:MAG: alternate F1F0 ATPase, F1 subunit alpha [Gammaproteobacteria bacterium]|nr:alternate F1F0 ATPase, F1 subunit alpha [Gammaproteobacteria bacterium]MCP5195375.1 alternate F1F0 ATPase, F1 subunit alpha [Gammaproteobacteria bacterium]
MNLDLFASFDAALAAYRPTLAAVETGVVEQVGQGIARVSGLPGVESMELVRFPNRVLGIAFNLDPKEVGVVLLSDSNALKAGDPVERVGRVVDTPVGFELLGRVVNALGEPLDEAGPLLTAERSPLERPAPAIMQRAPVSIPLATGIKVIDAAIPIGRGQRELILGDRQTGKTALAIDTILNQADQNVICVYCGIGQRGAAVARVIDDLRRRGALRYTFLVVAAGEDPPGLQVLTPYAATSMAEWFMARGHDVLIIYDDLTRHAQAYRELSLLLRRPPGREAYPGDIFYLHSRLLERATHLRPEQGGGSLSALPIVETEAQNLSAYIPTNLISITDGQIVLSPELARKGILPAVDVGQSVSRVGGKTQLPAYRAIAAELRLAYAQFEELETFARFGTRLDEATRRTIERGRRVREVLKQPPYQPLPVAEQVAVLLAVTEGVFDPIPLEQIAAAEQTVRTQVVARCPEIGSRIVSGSLLSAADRDTLLAVVRVVVAGFASDATMQASLPLGEG